KRPSDGLPVTRGDRSGCAATRANIRPSPLNSRPAGAYLSPAHHHIQAVLRHVDTAEREHGHLRILADACSCPGNLAGMEEAPGAPTSFTVSHPRRLRASSHDGG